MTVEVVAGIMILVIIVAFLGTVVWWVIQDAGRADPYGETGSEKEDEE